MGACRKRATFAGVETLSLAEIRAALPKAMPENAIVRRGFPELSAQFGLDRMLVIENTNQGFLLIPAV
jgi:hypothetical protein